uniref:RING-type E3 ubiquitin transferase n=1 Tax=Rhabditophanes sp. KR3021 TaxID=114890 RepID=A0AC35TG21_9BILA
MQTRMNNTLTQPMVKKSNSKQYFMGSCFFGMFLGAHGIVYLRRKADNTKIEKSVATVDFKDFVEQYLIEGKVREIIYQPPFSAGDVWLKNSENTTGGSIANAKAKFMMRLTSKKVETIARPPDIRFKYNGDIQLLTEIVGDVNAKIKEDTKEDSNSITYQINEFPSKGEFAFIGGTTLITLATILLL